MIRLYRGHSSYFKFFIFLILSLIALSCGVEKNTSAARNFHNLTSHYNIYFNAKESYKEGLLRAEESFVDDYTTILPLFYYEDEAIQQSLTPKMSRAIDKSTKVITFHSITAKPKVKGGKQTERDKAFYDKTEYNKWVDDCYLLIGQSYMYQGEFFLASESFKHTIRNFPEEASHLQAMIWLVRAYNVMNELDYAEELLVELQGVDDFPSEFGEELYTTLADFHIRKEEYSEAAENLELAMKFRPKRAARIRYNYILAQLYQKTKNGEASVENFKKVVRMNPPYVMAFNAKVSMAEAFQAGASGSDDIRKLLNKMLKDSKNTEYLDQIYYALGNISMEEGQSEKAIEYYHLSVSSSVQNSFQKGESCLTLAEIYYLEPKYTLSAAYYDTAVNLLQEDYPDYSTLKVRSISLNQLSRSITTFELQDSVQVLASLPEAERFSIIDKIIEDLRKEEEEAKRLEQEAMQDLQYSRSGMNNMNSASTVTNQSAGGTWYFYNLNAKSFGQPEFRMKWGERKLEDNWRRGNKQSMTDMVDEQGVEAIEELGNGKAQILDKKSREYYLKDIPLTDSAMDISHAKLEEALYDMAIIYKNDLLDYQKAIEALEELTSRYRDGAYTMPAYFYLHELYNNTQQADKAALNKNLLKSNYPESHMAKLLTNPNYISELESEVAKIENFYVQVFEKYQKEDYSGVISQANIGIANYPEEKEMVMRLYYLRAMATGAVRGKEAMKMELDSVVAWYPGTDIAKEAQGVIDYMYVAFPVIKEADLVKEAVELYTYQADAHHYLIIALKKDKDLNLVKFNLLNYNLDNFNNYDLEIEAQQLGDAYNLLMVKDFSNSDGVSRYMSRIEADIVQVMGEMSTEDYEILLISERNYQKLLEVKEFVPYKLFYRENYLK